MASCPFKNPSVPSHPYDLSTSGSIVRKYRPVGAMRHKADYSVVCHDTCDLGCGQFEIAVFKAELARHGNKVSIGKWKVLHLHTSLHPRSLRRAGKRAGTVYTGRLEIASCRNEGAHNPAITRP